MSGLLRLAACGLHCLMNVKNGNLTLGALYVLCPGSVLAVILILFALGVVMSGDNYVGRRCTNPGSGGIDLGVLVYGSPVVVLIIGILFSAKCPAGIAFLMCEGVLLVADVAIMAAMAGCINEKGARIHR